MAKTATLAQLRTRIRERADIEDSGFFPDSLLNNFINRSIERLYDILVGAYGADYYVSTTPHTINIVSGTKVYDLPATFYKVSGVDLRNGDDPIPLEPFMFAERNRYTNYYRRVNRDVTGFKYRIVGNQIWFTNPTSNEVVDVWYQPSFTDLSSDSDTFDGINGWEEWVVIDCAIKCRVREEGETQDLRVDLLKIETQIKEMAKTRDVGAPERVVDTNTYEYTGLDLEFYP